MNIQNLADTWYQVASSQVSGTKAVNVYGNATNLQTTSSFFDVWNYTFNATYKEIPTPTTASKIKYRSSSADDSGGKVGAHKIKIYGLNENYELVEEELPVVGTNIRLTENNYIRVLGAEVTEAGSFNSNIGNIDFWYESDSKKAAYIQYQESVTRMAFYTIPEGYTGYVVGYEAMFDKGTDINNEINVMLRIQENGVWKLADKGAIVSGMGKYSREWRPYLELPARTDVKITVNYGSVSNTTVNGRFSLILVENGNN